MKRSMLWIVFSVCLIGAAVSVGMIVWDSGPAISVAAVTVPATVEKALPPDEEPITITLLKEEDGPKFERKYVGHLPNDRTIVVTMKTVYHIYRPPERTGNYSQLIQANGHYVFFDPQRVAEKIIDPALVAPVEALSATILAMDAKWLAENAREFTDANGVTWRR